MARGRRPKPTHLHLVTGTHRPSRHGRREDAREAVAIAAQCFGPPVSPRSFRKLQREAWAKFITPATWLDASREPSAIALCELWSEFRSAPAQFAASRHSALRGYLADLGLTDARKRAVVQVKERDEFFDD